MRIPAADFTLQIIHSSDNESAFQDPNTGEAKILNYAAVAGSLRNLAFRDQMATLHLTIGDHTLPGPFYQAAAEIPEFGHRGLADIAFFNAMGLTANGIGNHEFDGGINDFAHMLAAADYPFIAANLDFSGVQPGQGAPDIEIGDDGASVQENAGKVCRSAYIEVNGEKIGLIGRAPADFFNVVADPEATLPGLDFYGGRDPGTNQPLVSALGQVLEQVDVLKGKGINKIILLDHAQDFTGDPLSAQNLRDIDIVVAAGSTGFMAAPEPDGPFNLLREGDASGAPYPTFRLDSEGNTVLVVNSDQLYRYVGQLIVSFDSFGHIKAIDPRSGPIATTAESVALLSAEIGRPAVPSGEVEHIWDLLQSSDSITDLFEVVGTTAEELNGERANVRGRETNLGRLVADSTLWYAREFAADEGIAFPVDIALKNGGGIRGTITGPNVTRLTVNAALAFDNRLALVEMTAAELLATMENAVSRYPALDGRFPQIAGLAVEFDPDLPGISDQESMTVPSRIKSLVVSRANGDLDVVVDGFAFQGDPSRSFGLATNNFLLTGGDGYRALKAISDDPSRDAFETLVGEQQILADYIIEALGGVVALVDPPADPRVREASAEVAPALLASYDAWASQFYDPSAPRGGMADDFNGDGFSNLFAYAFNLDPTSGSRTGALPGIARDADGSILLACTHRDDPFLLFDYEGASDLGDWRSMVQGGDFSLVAAQSNGDGTRTSILKVDPSSDLRFFRVRFSYGTAGQ
ncbi:MAG: 5'-nucleotidase C-terminal domain-containing protein [Verrucomicrobiales bacterium]